MTTPNKSLTMSIVEKLGMRIVGGDYNNKQFPTEAQLCTEYEVSRSVLREAVKMLTAKSLLSARPRQGTKVLPESRWNLLDPSILRWLLERDFSLQLLLEFNEIRLAIEPEASAFAAKRATSEQKASIQAALDRMQAAAEGKDDPLESDIEFHLSILAASGNRFYFQMSDFIETALRTSIRFTNQRKGIKLTGVHDHKKVKDAIFNNDPEAARANMLSLMKEAIQLISDAIKETTD